MDWIVTDIEGTTTSIDFVHRVLFPYSRSQMKPFLAEHAQDPDIAPWLEKIWRDDVRTHADANAPVQLEAVENALLKWIDEDRKHPALKALQGKIWREGYEKQAYRSHFYPDVPPFLEQWKAGGLRLAVYSSGSVEAQKLLFAHSEFGDLSGFISAYFDTEIGPKRAKKSYEELAARLDAKPQKILFLSDIIEELDAAAAAEIVTCQLLRPGTAPGTVHLQAHNFAEVSQKFGLV